ncbi:MAG: hypothetical protein LBS86_03000 [Treponema sp.]|jgi:hypothetical protein|nr:hypothetical protein [Treponema sp.]
MIKGDGLYSPTLYRNAVETATELVEVAAPSENAVMQGASTGSAPVCQSAVAEIVAGALVETATELVEGAAPSDNTVMQGASTGSAPVFAARLLKLWPVRLSNRLLSLSKWPPRRKTPSCRALRQAQRPCVKSAPNCTVTAAALL